MHANLYGVSKVYNLLKYDNNQKNRLLQEENR